MKKNLAVICVLATTSLLSLPVYAQGYSGTQQGGGYTGSSNVQVSTIAQAKNLVDDSYVVLRGKLVQQIDSEKYLLKDNTGEIVVEIDHDKWGGLNVGPNDLVQIKGEIDKDWHSLEVDVDFIQKVN
ncbi:YgiW/YdeI family stress tolerance OB fold protein [Neisseria sp. Ec49-e6-T10]|uniref:YgiW/YdeI family stress tolerance OB fold protein n=1 Tax=Neisseria sp. Ec49-e6-T10 TaxID=3140744 RepID=UPI003EB856AB